MSLTIGSLFSGIGGLELGLERAGLGPVLFQAERDPYCLAVLRRHWPDVRRYDDVHDIDASAPQVEILCGGFPCQPVSVAGQRKAQTDERWLWPEFARIAAALKPGVIVVENVPGLRTAGLRDVLADLAALGFDAEWSCLAAGENPERRHGWPHVGAPHERRRIFLVATHPNRVQLRLEPGWLSRAVWEGARESRDACEAWASANTAGLLRDEGGGQLRSWQSEPDEGDRRSRAVDATSWASANTAGVRGEGPEGDGRAAWRDGCERGGGDGETVDAASLADAHGEGQPQPRWTLGEVRGWASDSGWRHAPSAVRGVDDGVAAGLDASFADDARGDRSEARDDSAPDAWRIGALGNAVVPQVAEIVGRAIREAVHGR